MSAGEGEAQKRPAAPGGPGEAAFAEPEEGEQAKPRLTFVAREDGAGETCEENAGVAASAKEPGVPAETTDEASPMAPIPADLPAMGWGVLSAGLVYVFAVMYLLQVDVTMRSGIGWLPSPLMFYLASASLFAHCLWYALSRRKLLAATTAILPACSESTFQKCLLGALPLAVSTLLFVFINCGLLYVFEEYPLVGASPYLIAASFFYWFWGMTRWPGRLKEMFDQLRQAAHEDKSEQLSLPPLFAFFAGSITKRFNFPSIFRAMLMTPLLAVPYIWYWKNSIVATYRAKYPHAAGASSLLTLIFPEFAPTAPVDKKDAAIKGKRQLVIRYREHAGFERWIRQRFGGSEWRGLSRSKKIISYIGIPVCCAVGVLEIYLLALGVKNYWPTKALPHGVIGAVSTAHAVDNTGNYITLALFVLVTTAAFAWLTIQLRNQATHYQFTASGFKPFHWDGTKQIFGKETLWQEVKHIGLQTAGESRLVFKLRDGSETKLKLGSIESIEDREAVLTAIERWAPAVSRDVEAMEALQPPVDHSYTELWLQALAAPPDRDRLKPLGESVKLAEGRYEVKRPLGVGGQGVAYEAVDHNFGEVIVLKEFLLPIYVDISVRREVLERFEGEAKILKQLDHQQVVQLRDFFIEDHRAYLVLEHIDGTSLRDLVSKQGALGEERVRELAGQMCTILEYLHSCAPPVVHRDFTPENLILRNDGVLKLIDFNVARQIESTATGTVVGKPSYLPPEQFRGEPVVQSDIYGMGATLHYLLTGDDPEPISVSHPGSKNGELSASIDAIVAKATAIKTEDRFQSALDVADALRSPWSKEEKAVPAGGAGAQGIDGDAEDPSLTTAANMAARPQLTTSFKAVTRDIENPRLKVTEEHPIFAALKQSRLEAEQPQAPSAFHQKAKARRAAAGRMFAAALKPFIVASGAAAVLTVMMAACWAALPGSAPGWFDSNPKLHDQWRAYWGVRLQDRRQAAGYDELTKCIAIDPKFSKAYLARAFADTETGGTDITDKMIDDLQKAVVCEPDSKMAQAYLGMCLYTKHRYSEAEPHLKEALKLHMKQLPLQLAEGFATGALNNHLLKHNLILALIHQGKDEEASALYGPWIVERAVNLPCDYFIGALLDEMNHDPAAAEANVQKAMKQSPTPEGPLTYHTQHYETLKHARVELPQEQDTDGALWAVCEGLAYHAVNQYQKSNDYFSQAISLRPDFTDAYAWRADGLWRLKKLDAALKDADVVVEHEPENIRGHYLRARILKMMHRNDDCLAELDKLEALGLKDNETVYLLRGLCYDEAGKPQAALDSYSRLPEAKLGIATLFHKARACNELGQYEKARDLVTALEKRCGEFNDLVQWLGHEVEKSNPHADPEYNEYSAPPGYDWKTDRTVAVDTDENRWN